jgi:hypothetical protein
LTPVELGGLPVATDVSPGVWISSGRRRGEAGTVGALVPAVFEAYARIFHPAVRYVGDDDVEVRWADVAAHNRTKAHPLMQWASITGSWDYQHSDSQPPVWDDAPSEGHLPVTSAARLADVLARHTGTPDDCWFGRWVGFGFDGAALEPLPHLLLRGGQDVVLARGTVQDAVRNLAPEPHEQSANLWWPADQAWCVVTDIDLSSTYVGGSAACIAELRATPGLEVAPAFPADRVSIDPVNPIPSRN